MPTLLVMGRPGKEQGHSHLSPISSMPGSLWEGIYPYEERASDPHMIGSEAEAILSTAEGFWLGGSRAVLP